ncbi:MAG: thioredoxin domain-containing protein [Planctomycetota bacterium]
MRPTCRALASSIVLAACGSAQEGEPSAQDGTDQVPRQEAPGQEAHDVHQKSGKANRLIDETSPYLLQHAYNPVDWHPWGAEALELAKELDRPIFLSIGYSACHWCHVMERESFENEEIAKQMNESFVCIKVDREERPDIDDIYMQAVQAMTGSGGWPMSVFLTPDLEPFFGGTYYPPVRRFNRPSFPDVMRHVDSIWNNQREQAVQQGQKLAEYISQQGTAKTSGELDPSLLDRSLGALQQSYDPTWGGFGSAPKFPHSGDIRIALRHGLRTGNPEARDMALITLDRMSEGGIYDHLAGGFARYSTDEKWLIPHFEKMLYDNALLIPAFLEAYLVSGEERYARVARECCDWVLSEMLAEGGSFASTLDADSEGEEGKFYVWTPDELTAVLGPKKGAWAAAWFGVTDEGNFEHGTSALWRHNAPEVVAAELRVELEELEQAMAEARVELLAERAKRIRPGQDDKVLAAWNGLMISALAQTWQVLGDDRYLDAARAASRYVLTEMRQEDGRLFATARDGHAHLNAYLDDYAFLMQGLLDVFESDFDPHWLEEALALNDVLTARFWDDAEGGYFTTGVDHEKLIARLKGPHDGALPSGNGVQAMNLLRLAELTGETEHAVRAEKTIQSVGELMNRYPHAFSQMLMAVDVLATGAREIVIAGEPGSEPVEAMLREVRGTFLPQRVVVLAGSVDAELVPLVEGKTAAEGKARAFVCRNYVCKLPVDDVEGLRKELSN